MQKHKHTILLLFIPLSLILAFVYIDGYNAFIIGGDDGCELSKSLLLHSNYLEASRMWNDQPWLYTIMTSWLFNIFGVNAIFPRMITSLSVVGMFYALYYSTKNTWGVLENALSFILFISAEIMLRLSWSSMLEMPAIAMGVAIAFITLKPDKPRLYIRYIASGCAFAIICHIKLTALIILPAFCITVVWQHGYAQSIKCLLLWFVCFISCFLSIGLLMPTFSYYDLFGSHMMAKQLLIDSNDKSLSFNMFYILAHPALLVCAIMGMLRYTKDAFNHINSFSIVLLTTSIIVAGNQMPWWKYYLIHIYVPMSILGGYGMAWLLRSSIYGIRNATVSASEGNSLMKSLKHGRWDVLISCVAISLWAGFTLPRFVDDIVALRDNPSTNKDLMILAMQKYSQKTEWCYTQQPEYAFHSGLSIPPELCVLPTKRYLTTDLNPERILRIAETYRPGVLLLGRNSELTNAFWKKWIDQGYILNVQNDTMELWIDKKLNPESLEEHHSKLNIMGL